MKKHLFNIRVLSFMVLCCVAFAFASCAKEDVAQNPTKPREETGMSLTTFVAGGENKTRTSLDYESGNFYWEAGDYIYVKDDDGVMRKSTNAPTERVAAFDYKVPGKFTDHDSYKVYYLGKHSNGNSVTIPTNQSQTIPGNTNHFGDAGDYGVATATGIIGGKAFSFELEHQPSYLVFQPYTSKTILQNCYLTKVEVTSDNDIAETYTINPTTGVLEASAVTDGNKIVLTTMGNSSNPNGFPLITSTPSVTTNGAYMVIKPGTHILKVRYWLKDVATQVEGAITKIYPSTNYSSNIYYDMTANLDDRYYNGDDYYMWDAKQPYWKGYEWDKGGSQPTIEGSKSNMYAQDEHDPRFYSESKPEGTLARYSCAGLPNANKQSWYVMHGDPRWDSDELWTTMGRIYKGGMWFKKKSVLQAEGHYNTEISADEVTDLRKTSRKYTNNSRNNSEVSSAADAGNYFFLPASGFYYKGELTFIGRGGHFWSSTASPTWSDFPYFLSFISTGLVFLNYNHSFHGLRVRPLE